jgi:hypothetical protein
VRELLSKSLENPRRCLTNKVFDQIDEKLSILLRSAGVPRKLASQSSPEKQGPNQMSFGKRQPIGYRGFERRRGVREKADISAHIVLPASHLVRCQMKNFSTYGALLTVSSALGLPDAFELRGLGRECHVRVARRGIGRAAVVFL